MIECEQCNYTNNPPEELNCLYCRAKLNTIQVSKVSKKHFDSLYQALDYLEENPDALVGEITMTDQNHTVYNDKLTGRVIFKINPVLFMKSYYHDDWFDLRNSLPSNYRVDNVAQTRRDIILVFLKKLD